MTAKNTKLGVTSLFVSVLIAAATATGAGAHASLIGVAATGALKSTTSAARVVVPNVVGMRMDQATRTLHARNIRVNEECSGLFGCIVKSGWWVCTQSPRPGSRIAAFSVVVIYAERRGEC